MKVKSLSRVWLLSTPWTAAHHTIRFSNQGQILQAPYLEHKVGPHHKTIEIMGLKSSFLVCFMIRIFFFLRFFLTYKPLVWPLPVLPLFARPHLTASDSPPPPAPLPASAHPPTPRRRAHTVTGTVGSLSLDRKVCVSQAEKSKMRNLGETQVKWTRSPGRNFTWLTSKVNVPARPLAWCERLQPES